MGEWIVDPSDGVRIEGIGETVNITFTNNNTYTVKYTDDYGHCGTKTVTVDNCTEPPTPTCNMPCDFERTYTGDVPNDNNVNSVDLFSHDSTCPINDLSITSNGGELANTPFTDNNGVITVNFNKNSGSRREIKLNVSANGEICEYTVYQAGSTPPVPSEFAIPVTTTFKIVNTGTSSVNFDAEINISLTNPTRIGDTDYYWGGSPITNCNCYSGTHNRTGHINLKTGKIRPDDRSDTVDNVTLDGGQDKSYTFKLTYEGSGIPMCVGCNGNQILKVNGGIGNRYPADESRNIQIYKNGNTVFEYKLDPNTPFTEGGIYIINVG